MAELLSSQNSFQLSVSPKTHPTLNLVTYQNLHFISTIHGPWHDMWVLSLYLLLVPVFFLNFWCFLKHSFPPHDSSLHCLSYSSLGSGPSMELPSMIPLLINCSPPLQGLNSPCNFPPQNYSSASVLIFSRFWAPLDHAIFCSQYISGASHLLQSKSQLTQRGQWGPRWDIIRNIFVTVPLSHSSFPVSLFPLMLPSLVFQT